MHVQCFFLCDDYPAEVFIVAFCVIYNSRTGFKHHHSPLSVVARFLRRRPSLLLLQMFYYSCSRLYIRLCRGGCTNIAHRLLLSIVCHEEHYIGFRRLRNPFVRSFLLVCRPLPFLQDQLVTNDAQRLRQMDLSGWTGEDYVAPTAFAFSFYSYITPSRSVFYNSPPVFLLGRTASAAAPAVDVDRCTYRGLFCYGHLISSRISSFPTTFNLCATCTCRCGQL